MAISAKLLVLVFLLCFLQGESIEERSAQSIDTHVISEIFNQLIQSYQLSLWQNAMLFTVCIIIFSSKPFKAKFVNFKAMYLKLVMKTIFGAGLVLLMIPVVLPFYLIFFTIKKVVELIVLFQYGNATTKSTGTDIMWGSGPKVSQPFVTVAMKLEGSPDLKFIKETISRRVLNYQTPDGRRPFKKFQQTYDTYYGYFFWKNCKHFDIDNHIKLVNLTELYQDLGDQEVLNQHLKSVDPLFSHYLRDVGFQRLPEGLPQWEINFLTNNKDTGYIMYFKLHHAIGDGMSLLRFLMEHIVDNPVKISFLQLPPNPLKRFLYSLWSITFIPFTIKFLLLDRTPNPLHGQKLSGNKILVSSEPISLDLVKSIKNKTKASVVDVLFSCVSFAIASHFERCSSNVEKINIFYPVGFEDMNAPINLCNKFTIGVSSLLTLPDDRMLSKFPDLKGEGPALKRLFKIKEYLDEVKQGPAVLSLYYLSSMIVEILPLSLTKKCFTSNGLTLAISNVPGPNNEIYAMGSRVTEMKFWVPDREPNGCGFTIMSYNGQIRLGISVDEVFVGSRKEAGKIIDDFGLQLSKLSQELNLNTKDTSF